MCMCYILPKKFKRNIVVFVLGRVKVTDIFDDVLR